MKSHLFNKLLTPLIVLGGKNSNEKNGCLHSILLFNKRSNGTEEEPVDDVDSPEQLRSRSLLAEAFLQCTVTHMKILKTKENEII
uniref:Uncharacterized protein n=1 Tax=Romanomermis culicivorax TaxID=13658 RepID=A0A915JK37_ROMCU